MRDLDEADLERLQNLSVAVMAAATATPEDAIPPDEEEVMLSVPSLCDEVRHLQQENRTLRDCLEGMAWQFGLVFERTGERWIGTAGLSNLEWAFDVLGWDDPHPIPADHAP